MRVVDQETGRPYYLDRTPELDADLDVFDKAHCNHDAVEIRQRKDGGGASHYYRQCVACGTSVGSALKKSSELLNSPPWQVDHEEKFNAGREAERLAIYQKHIRRQRNREDGFQRKYDIYLKSDEWYARRAKILKRAGGICEGCLETKATQVHHKTYENIGNEFMFELIAICEPCHHRLRPEKHGEDETIELDEDDLPVEWVEGHVCDGCRHSSEKGSLRWCFILDQNATDALSNVGDCGPSRASFEPLR